MENSSAEDAKDLFTNENNDAKDASKEGEQKPAPAKKRTRKRIKVEAPVQENKNEESTTSKETSAKPSLEEKKTDSQAASKICPSYFRLMSVLCLSYVL